jgi:hypothetical protein
MYAFIGLFLISLYKKKSLKMQLTYLLAEILGYLLTKDAIFIYLSQDFQIWLSIIYLSLASIGVLHFSMSSKVNIIFKKGNFKQHVNLANQIETKPKDVNPETQLDKKQNIQDTTIESLIEDAHKLLVETHKTTKRST